MIFTNYVSAMGGKPTEGLKRQRTGVTVDVLVVIIHGSVSYIRACIALAHVSISTAKYRELESS